MECLKLDMRFVVRKQIRIEIARSAIGGGWPSCIFLLEALFRRRPYRPIAHAVSANRVCRHNPKRRALDARLPANAKHPPKHRKTLAGRHVTRGFSVSRGLLEYKLHPF